MISVTDDPDAANDQFEVGSVTFFFLLHGFQAFDERETMSRGHACG